MRMCILNRTFQNLSWRQYELASLRIMGDGICTWIWEMDSVHGKVSELWGHLDVVLALGKIKGSHNYTIRNVNTYMEYSGDGLQGVIAIS